jgi:hypothetical protein
MYFDIVPPVNKKKPQQLVYGGSKKAGQ